MDRDPAPDARTPHAGETPAAQPLTDILLTPPERSSRPPAAAARRGSVPIEITIDGRSVTVPAGATILDACRAEGIDTPTLCYADNLTPVNVCRVCVVEVTGSRVLVPACSRRAEPGMEIQTDSERVRLSRKVVLEFLGSSVDMSLTGPTAPDGSIAAYAERYGADASRFGPPTPRRHPASGTRTRPDITTRPPRTAPRRRSASRRRSTTSCTSGTTRNASSATSASKRAARTPRTRSPSPSRVVASTPASRPSRPCRSPSQPASIAGTASASARPAR